MVDFMVLEVESIANVIFLIATVVFIVIAIELKNLIKSTISLGIASALIAIVFYILEAPIAAIFELSVCAGLVTILLLSAIGMLGKKEEC